MQTKRGQRLPDALSVRDAALVKLRAEGTLTVGKGVKWHGHGLFMQYRTPFQPWQDPDPKEVAWALSYGVVYKRNLPYGLDIWDPDRKVLNIEWDDKGLVELIRFIRGDWERTVLAFSREHP